MFPIVALPLPLVAVALAAIVFAATRLVVTRRGC
jgi:hypothetical protein